ncbi:MAG: hypothetical protein KDD11_18745 [Acidobacteria bacterium]|nr:hypothetical protein [Acidobacteriota bacterium]
MSLETRRFRATAYHRQSDEVLFTETHEETWNDGHPVSSEVLYHHPDGEVFARKWVEYGNDPCVPSFELDDFRDGYKEGASAVDDGVELFCRKRKDEPTEHRRIEVDDETAIDEGSHHLVLAHWDRLATGKTVELDFAVPYRREVFGFRLVPERAEPVAGRPVLGLRLEVASRLLRFLVDPVHLVYDRETRRLLTFEGITGINDADGHSHRARIVFEYPDDTPS